jgi:5-methylthioadenosine/S-adenosylhomocysteine deaminase
MVTRDAAEIAGLGDKLGALAEERPADVLVLERHVEDPWENVLEADSLVGGARDDRRRPGLPGTR